MKFAQFCRIFKLTCRKVPERICHILYWADPPLYRDIARNSGRRTEKSWQTSRVIRSATANSCGTTGDLSIITQQWGRQRQQQQQQRQTSRVIRSALANSCGTTGDPSIITITILHHKYLGNTFGSGEQICLKMLFALVCVTNVSKTLQWHEHIHPWRYLRNS